MTPLNEKQLDRLHRAFVFGFITFKTEMQQCGWSYEAVTGAISAAVRNDWLQACPIGNGITGFQPTLAAARELGANPSLVRPFGGPQSILPRFAVLTDCGNRKVQPIAFKRVPLNELKADDYRMIPGEHHPICYAHVDTGANPLRMFHRVNEYFHKFSDLHPFAVRILTPSHGKARALAALFEKRKLRGPVEIEVIQELQSWLA